MQTRRHLMALAVMVLVAPPALAQDKSIVVSSTTTTHDSGLFGHILPLFKAKTGIDVKVLSLATGQALDIGRRGNADVVFTHAKQMEERFVADGFGVKRFPVMYNDFILVGPKNDPAGVKGRDIVKAFATIETKAAPFISRGDRSGTHVTERAMWRIAQVEITAADKGSWYKESGQGQGETLSTASASNAYVFTDRGTWLSFTNRGQLDILVEGDNRLTNQYGVVLVNPAKHPQVKTELGQQFIDWIISAEGQKAIADYKINGQQLFFPNADKPGA